jgi:membrane protein YqaA with SNARE-associated domain
MSRIVRSWISKLQKHSGRWWYAPVVAVLAGLDAFVIVIPTDGLLVGAVMLAPRRWIYTALVVTLGSTLGALTLAALLEVHGLPFLLEIKPGIDQGSLWVWTDKMMDSYGGWALFAVALSPIMQHPAVALAALAGMPLWEIFVCVFLGRAIKYLFISWVCTHAPGLLSRLWGIQGDLEEVGVAKPK